MWRGGGFARRSTNITRAHSRRPKGVRGGGLKESAEKYRDPLTVFAVGWQ
jgi:hypothetical protein